MYRYSVDNAITYTSEDFVLFREAPFACWMERLTLENPDHGIPPDLGSAAPRSSMERQDDLAETLRAEGKNVAHISWDKDEATRRSATLEAMRSGADYIVDGQLALGPLSGPANLLVRTSGYSELGDYLYTPCDTQARSRLHSAFRLCFLADLLHSLQGQLPPQMLLIRDGEDVQSLATEDHIYHYRAVKQRFMEAMRNFRKHRMPDPAESSHFGRWSDCAHEVLKQRLQRQEEQGLQQQEAPGEVAAEGMLVEPLQQAAAGGAAVAPPQRAPSPVVAADTTTAYTLAEQAQRLQPGTYKPGPGYFRLRQLKVGGAGPSKPGSALAARSGLKESPEVVPAAETPRHNRRASDKALQNLEFIGSSQFAPLLDAGPGPEAAPPPGSAPSPSLRSPRRPAATLNQAVVSTPVNHASLGGLDWEAPASEITQLREGDAGPGEPEPGEPESEAAAEPAFESVSLVDRDSFHELSPPPVFTTADASYEDEEQLESAQEPPVTRPFSNSIFNDPLFTDPLFVDSDTPTVRPGHERPGHERPGHARSNPISDTLITSDEFGE
ncbi:MAG: hypothetical protein KDI04_16480 [Halieaceae bacterium]|nr:hypothetical protein [Halieaceae bacterium]MCP5186254.1 hypothetical protein [Pseudomonadales bacterium]